MNELINSKNERVNMSTETEKPRSCNTSQTKQKTKKNSSNSIDFIGHTETLLFKYKYE